MYGLVIVNFASAQRAKKHINTKTPKLKRTRVTQQCGIIKHASKKTSKA
jgi:hypothetical protein